MSAYPWLQRHKRYLSFRYLFPRVAAPWIQARRLWLRIRWFFSYSVDEFLEELRHTLLWPWHQLEHVGRWITEAGQWTAVAVYEFFRDLFYGIDFSLHWLGRLPVWTGASIAGVMGIMLTLLLFLLPSWQTPLQTPPVVASIAATTPQQPAPPQPLLSSHPEGHSHPERETSAEDEFDIFAEPDSSADDTWPSVPGHSPEAPFGEPRLVTEVARLSLPVNREQRIHVTSRSAAVPRRETWSSFDQFAIRDGWSPPRLDRVDRVGGFSPYASRLDPHFKRMTPSWISPEADVPSTSPFASRRQPAVVVEKLAPATAAVGRPLQYSLIVKNLSNERLESVTVRERVSAIERVSNVHPSANIVGDELVWNVAELRPGEHRRLQVELFPDQRTTLAQTTTVAVTTGVAVVSEAQPPSPAADSDAGSPLAQNDSDPVPEMILPDFDPEPSAPAIPNAEPADEPIPAADPIRDDPQSEFFPENLDWASDPASALPAQDEPLPAQKEPLPAQDEPPLDESLVLPPAAASPKDVPHAEERDHDRELPGNPLSGQSEPSRPAELPDGSSRNEPQPPAPADPLTLQMLTPPVVPAGSYVRTIFELRNRGQTDLSDIVLTVELSQQLQHKHGRTLQLRIDRLTAGETYRTTLTTQAVQDGKATLASKVTSPGTQQLTAQREIHINGRVSRSANLAFGIPRVYHPPPRCVPWRF